MALTAILDRLARLGRFLWSGWAGLAGLCLLAALWQAGHEAYGDFILPAPLVTVQAAGALLGQSKAQAILALTTHRALEGFAITALLGTLLGVAAGYSPAMMRLSRPLLTVLIGVPPIAWIVLAMIWFGSSSGTITTTVVVAGLPLVFAGAAEGAALRDRALDDMARAFGAGPLYRLRTIGARQVSQHLFPALVVALGSSFKVAVMAELLANTGGIGGALAIARSNLDIAQALAFVLLAVLALLVVEYGLLHPLRAEFERWREAARPWGVKR